MPDTSLHDEVLLVLEGATDAIARTRSASRTRSGAVLHGGNRHVVALVGRTSRPRVVIVRDNDEPGVRGAEALARVLRAPLPRRARDRPARHGMKDMRDWVAAGATRARRRTNHLRLPTYGD